MNVNRDDITLLLDRQAQEAVRDAELWPNIRVRLEARRLQTSERRLLVRLAQLGACFVAAALLTAGAYVGVSTDLADRLWSAFRFTDQQEGEHMLGLSETIHGVTVTVDRVIYDGKLVEYKGRPSEPTRELAPVFIQFTVSGLPTDPSTYSVREFLMDGGANVLSRVGGVGQRGKSDLVDKQLAPGTLTSLHAYDITATKIDPSGMQFRLEVTVLQLTKADSTDIPGSLTRYKPEPDPLAGPFVFEFMVPGK